MNKRQLFRKGNYALTMFNFLFDLKEENDPLCKWFGEMLDYYELKMYRKGWYKEFWRSK